MGIIIALYVIAITILFISFFKVYTNENGIENHNWIFLTFSLIIMFIPVSLHIGLLNKLYKKGNSEDTEIDMNHPLILSIARLINSIADKIK